MLKEVDGVLGVSEELSQVLRAVLGRWETDGRATEDAPRINDGIPEAALRWEIPKDPSFGDLSNAVSFRLAAKRRQPPQAVAQELSQLFFAGCQQGSLASRIDRVEAKGGFLNVFLSQGALTHVLRDVLKQARRFGTRRLAQAPAVNIEFVSANPTGPLSVAHGRQAAVGDVLARLLRSQGYKVTAEYYLNDEGRQIELLGRSLRVRYLQELRRQEPFPEDGYHGSYVIDSAKRLVQQHGDRLVGKPERFFAKYGMSELLGVIRRDLERFGLRFSRWTSQRWLRISGRVDQALETLRNKQVLYQAVSPLLSRLTQLLPHEASVGQRQQLGAALLSSSPETFPRLLDAAGIADTRIHQELADYVKAVEPIGRQLQAVVPVLPERTRQELLLELISSPAAELPQVLQRRGIDDPRVRQRVAALIEAEEATWFASTRFGDDKDRVVRKRNGELTYLAPDIAYHQWKFQRGYDQLVNFWGPDHHGYIMRLKASVAALGFAPERLTIRIVQLVTLSRSGKPVPMSKRQGEFVTFREVIDEVGVDATRFFFLMRTMESHLDFDLELAKAQSQENPVYYIQYAHARISSILAKQPESLAKIRPNFSRLTEPEERLLMRWLFQYPVVLQLCAAALEPHGVTVYLRKLAETFHVFYTKHRVIGDDPDRSAARLALIQATRHVFANGLGILGVSAPQQM